MADRESDSTSTSFSRFAHEAFDDKFSLNGPPELGCTHVEEEERNACCCKTFCDTLRFIGIVLAKACYIICPPVPELVTRKLAFYPPAKGLSYRLITFDALNHLIVVRNAKKATEYDSVEIEVNRLWEGRPMPMDRIETFFIRTSSGSYLTVILAKKRHRPRGAKGAELVVIFSQPNGSDLGFFLQPMVYRSHPCNLRFLADKLHADVYAYDYSGYGMSTGYSSENNIYRDLDAVYEHVLDTRGPNIRVVLMGYSMGTAATVAVASRHPQNLCGVVLVAPFTSGFRLLFGCETDEETCCMDRFLSYDRAPSVEVPTLICHGMKDRVVPVGHGMALNARFPRAVKPHYLPEADHISIFTCKFISVFFRIYVFLHHETDSLAPTATEPTAS